jgi:hypothetical protein
MATELHWPRRATFVVSGAEGHDSEEHRYVGPGTFEVPDAYVDQFLDRGWEHPGEAESEEAPAAASQPEPEAAAEAEAEAETDGFDAAGFVDDSWQSVVAAIEDGEAEGHLEAVREAEENREGDPRNSVIEAIETQQAG